MVATNGMNAMDTRKIVVGYSHSEDVQHGSVHDATNDHTERDEAMRLYNEYKKRMIKESIRRQQTDDTDVTSFFAGIGVFVAVFVIVFILTYLMLKAEGL
jgi:hypothetical protein